MPHQAVTRNKFSYTRAALALTRVVAARRHFYRLYSSLPLFKASTSSFILFLLLLYC